MGIVLLAHDTMLHRQVALKILDSPAESESARARLLREARSAAALNHPNIARSSKSAKPMVVHSSRWSTSKDGPWTIGSQSPPFRWRKP
jgi:serine/threonine protein kinase